MSALFDAIRGQTVWVTGSAVRVGRCIALELARAGADVVIHCNHSRNEAERTVADLKSLGRRSILVQGDHSRREDVARMVSEIGNQFGQLTALVNNASVYPKKAFDQTTDEELRASLDANLVGPFLCSQLALPLLRNAPDPARIIMIGDARLEHPAEGFAAYWSAKGGVDALTRQLAVELAPRVLVNAIAPGPIIPPEDSDEDYRRRSIARTLVQRWGKPEDIARAVLFLLCSDYITGSTIPVDGGRRIG